MPAKTHGMSYSLTYSSWKKMRSRCRNRNDGRWDDYGGRGITIDPRWDSFQAFLADMGDRPSPRHSLERVDNSKGYEPGNCVWAIPLVQMRNTRRNRFIEFGGKRQCLSAWSAERGIPYDTLFARINRGWPVGRALGYGTNEGCG